MVARDEADIIEATVRHLLWHADEVIVMDHRSTDGTREILEGLPVEVRSDDELGFWQEERTTALAMEALRRGHEWVIPCDADELWHVRDAPGLRVADYLGQVRRATFVYGCLYDYVPTAVDEVAEANPVRRLGWRKRNHTCLKVACRLRADLKITMGNHDAEVAGETVADYGLDIRHYSYRAEGQFLRKVRVGLDSYSVEAGMPPGFDIGWAQWRGLTDDEIVAAFRARFWSADPESDPSLIYDPAP